MAGGLLIKTVDGQIIGGTAQGIGHSMGGKASMLLALAHPDKVARMIVADATGDLQINVFEGVDTLVARLRVNTAYRFPLAGAVIKLKDEKWNRTTGSAYEVKLSKLGAQHVREEDDDHGARAAPSDGSSSFEAPRIL